MLGRLQIGLCLSLRLDPLEIIGLFGLLPGGAAGQLLCVRNCFLGLWRFRVVIRIVK